MVKFASTNKLMTGLNKGSFSNAKVYAHSVVQEYEGVDAVYEDYDNGKPAEFVAQINVLNIDADRFLSGIHNYTWDVIIIDFPDPSSVELAKLYSREFYKKLQHLMTPHTVIAIQSTSPYHAKESYLAIKRTIEAAGLHTIPYHENIPSFGDWGYLLAYTDSTVPHKLKNITQLHVPTTFVTPDVIQASLVFGKDELISNNTCINSLMFPCLVDIYTNYSWLIE